MRGAILLAILAAAMATPADAARKRAPVATPPAPSLVEPSDSVLSVRPSEDGTSLIVTGWLDVGSFIKFRRVLAANPGVKSVRLSSAGGVIQEGGLLASTIRDAKLSTSVETLCASACTLALAAGIERSAAADAWIGFHRARWLPKEGLAAGPGAAEPDPDVLQRGIFRRAGIDPGFIATALNVPPDGVWFPDRAELLAANVLTGSQGEAPAPDTGQIKAQTAAAMRAMPLWAGAERAVPTEFARAFALTWRLAATGIDEAAIMAEAQSGLARAMLPRIAAAPVPLAYAFLDSIAKADPGGCLTTGWGARLPVQAQQAAQAELLTKILERTPSEPEMGLKDARRTLRKPAAKTLAAFPGLKRASDADLRCRAGLDLVQRIAALDGDKRRRAFQAYAVMQSAGELPAYAIPL